MRGKHKGQVSTEYLAIVALFLLMTIPIFSYFYISAPEKEYYNSVIQAEQVANDIIDNSRLVSTNLYGTKISRVNVIPKYATNITFKDNTVVITVERFDLKTQVVRQGAVKFNESVVDVYGGVSYTLVYENTKDGVHVSAPKFIEGG